MPSSSTDIGDEVAVYRSADDVKILYRNLYFDELLLRHIYIPLALSVGQTYDKGAGIKNL